MVKTPGAASGPRALRPLNLPAPVRVRSADGWPSAVMQGSGYQDVASVEDLWRVEEEWWRDAPIIRTYFEVLLETGRRLTLYFDHLTSAWFQQRHG